MEQQRSEDLSMKHHLPFVIQAPTDASALDTWVESNRCTWSDALLTHGAVLWRGFRLPDGEGFEACPRLFFDETLSYIYRSTPRTEVGKGVYTATEYPKQFEIPQHSEESYARDWPLRLLFYSDTPATSGGETPLSDNRVTTALLSQRVKDRFEEKKICYVRNYGGGVDLSWQVVFQTEDRSAVERYCSEHDIEYEWLGNRLRTRQVCPAFATHPVTGDRVWFNQAHLFHVSSLDPRMRQAMLRLFKPEDLPRNSYYGDGTEIEPETLHEIRTAFADAIPVQWQRGDLVLVDNMLAAHGRRPFEGPRKTLVSMGDAYSAFRRRTAEQQIQPESVYSSARTAAHSAPLTGELSVHENRRLPV